MRRQIRLTDSQERWSIVKCSVRSQILFRHGRRWEALTRAGYIPTAASLVLAQPFLLLLWLAIGVFPAWAQTGASLSGVVTDQTGTALREVAVTIKNVDANVTRTIATDDVGHYQASGLPPGRFEIRAAKQGFPDETHTGIILAVGQDATVDMRLRTPDVCASGHEFATIDSSSHRTTCNRRVSASGARNSLRPAGRLCSTLQLASIRSPAC